LRSNPSPVKDVSLDESSFETVTCDVLIVGAGGAGMRAAIGAFDAGSNTPVVSKTLFGKAPTVMAGGGIAAVLGIFG